MKWSTEEKGKLMSLYREKKSYSDIAMALNRSLKSVSCMIETLHRDGILGFNREHERYTQTELEKLIELAYDEKSLKDVAFKLGRSVDSVKMKLFFFREKLKRR